MLERAGLEAAFRAVQGGYDTDALDIAISAYLEAVGGEPVAWQIGVDGALYATKEAANKHVAGWAAMNVRCDDPRPLYAAPQAPAVRVKGLADKLKLAEYVMTKDSFCEAERLEEGLSVVRRIRSALEAETGGGEHPDDLAVDRFAIAMKAKLAKKRAEGRGGWDDPVECSTEHLSFLLIQHCLKGDPLDVGNLAMMLHQRGDRIVIDDETKSIMPKSATTTDERAVEALTRNIEKTADQLAASLGFLVRDWFTGPNPLEGDGLEHVIKLRIHRLLTEAALAQGESRNG